MCCAKRAAGGVIAAADSVANGLGRANRTPFRAVGATGPPVTAEGAWWCAAESAADAANLGGIAG